MSHTFIEKFRKGEFGKMVLDELVASPELDRTFDFELLPNEQFISSSNSGGQ
jgi:hypothetical protein